MTQIHPDLLWLDLDLPRVYGPSSALEGLAFLKRLRAGEAGRGMDAIVVSHRYGPDLDPMLDELRVGGRWSKPPDLLAIRAILRSLRSASR